MDERVLIADAHRAGVSMWQIAGQLGGAPSTISREIRANRCVRIGPSGREHLSARRYGPEAAERKARARRRRPKLRKLAMDPVLHAPVQTG